MAILLRNLCLFSLFFHAVVAQLGGPVFDALDPFGNIMNGGGGGGDDDDDDDASDDFGEQSESNGFGTNYLGGWKLVSQNSGVSAMHLVTFNNNKAIMFDTSAFGPSQLPLPGNTDCRPIPGSTTNGMDCFAHAVEYDIDTAAVRPLRILTDTWCSSGGLNAEGVLVQTGGWNDGGRSVRYLKPCDTCDWTEYPVALSGQRWYATTLHLPDDSFIVVGGRRMFNYEYVPPEGQNNVVTYDLPFLKDTTDVSENNLYPFVHLSPDGNVFIFANNRAILLDVTKKKVIREFPPLEGGARNYPGSGMSALLPLRLDGTPNQVVHGEVVVCGGAKPEGFQLAEKFNFLPALDSCGRIRITDGDNAKWKMETMPSRRVMGDMLILPTGDLLIINGAKVGVSGWAYADQPNLIPVLYRPLRPRAERFTELTPTTIPRMYHSTSAVLPDGSILVAGSNTNNMYNLTGVKYPTELRIEKFLPPYLDPVLESNRPEIRSSFANTPITYGQTFDVDIHVNALFVQQTDFKVTMYAPPFTTHGFSQNQRMLILATQNVGGLIPGYKTISVVAPPNAVIAPPGYYLLFVNYRGLPSKGEWIKIGK